MGFERSKMEINLAGIRYQIQSLVPVDFLGEECWPFCFYRLKGEAEQEKNAWQWEGGLKPDWLLEAEARIRKVLALGIVSPSPSPSDLVELCQDKNLLPLKNFLFGAIFALTYGITDEKEFERERTLDRTHLEEIGIKSRELKREPWEIIFGTDGPAEGFNPKRHDFNTLVLRIMFERDGELARRRNDG
jgi:hypothetical protein